MTLPPGPHPIVGLPRFGTHLHLPAPAVPRDPAVEIKGDVIEPLRVPVADLATLPRRELIADFHCVTGWSAANLRWKAVAFDTFYRVIIAPSLRTEASSHLVFEGLDGYRSVVSIDDPLAGDVLIAEHLNGRPLDSDHGAPARWLCPPDRRMDLKPLCVMPRQCRSEERVMPETDRTVDPAHPFRAFWESGDLEVWTDALAPDVVLHSPMITAPFIGRQTAAELYGVLFDRLENVAVVDEFSSGNSYVCLWRADVGGRRIEGADFIRSNAQGKIAEVRVLIRPLVSIAAFAQGVGLPLAAKQGRLRGVLIGLFNIPFRFLAALTDAVAPRLVLRRRTEGEE